MAFDLIGAIPCLKNLIIFITSFASFLLLGANKKLKEKGLEDCKLVIAGDKGWLYKQIFKKIEDNDLENEVLFLGIIRDEDMPMLYNCAEMFIYPSLYEGFGLPPLEAMACGIPIITSNTSSLPEVVGNSGIMVDPSDTNSCK